MNKKTIINYFKGDASDKEIDELFHWVRKSEKNEKYFADMKFLWDLSADAKSVSNVENRTGNILKICYFSTAAAIIILLICNIFMHRTKVRVADDGNKLLAENVEVFTHKGVVSKVILPDSTVVWMNAGTKLQYPSEFSDGLREVHISGEAFFEVKRDESRPMVITTNRNAGISVLGTSFLVKSYEDEEISKVTLFNGSVRYSEPDREDVDVILRPGESIICSDADSSFKVVEVEDLSREIAWRDGNLIFDKTPMRDVIRTLERWYGTEFKILNENIYSYTLTATFYSESITQVMELIKYCIPVKYAKENNVVTIYSK